MLPGGGQLGQQASVFGFQFRDAGLELRVVFAQSSDFLLLLLLAPLAAKPSHAYAS
jgi:hypothetical protein